MGGWLGGGGVMNGCLKGGWLFVGRGVMNGCLKGGWLFVG